ncbi:MAG: hypothetical protein GY794_09205, partial [bacterium]|nr:hypothetical protein [bacterium]
GVILSDSTAVHPLLLVRAANPQFKDALIAGFDLSLPSYADDPRGYRRALAERSLYVVSPEQGGLPPELLADVEMVPCPSDSPVLYRLEWKQPSATAR